MKPTVKNEAAIKIHIMLAGFPEIRKLVLIIGMIK